MVLVQIVDDSKPNPRSKFVSNVPGLAASNELINDGSVKYSTMRRHNRRLKLIFQEEIGVAKDLVWRIGGKDVLTNI